MNFVTARQHGKFTYHGHTYELEPISYPEVNLRNILSVSYPMDVAICRENPETMQAVHFEAQKLPGFPKPLLITPQELKEGSRLMLVRGGGIGDVIMLTSAIRCLREILGKKISISVSTFADCIPLLDGLGYIDSFHPHPIRLYDFMTSCDYYMDFPDPKGIFNHTDMIDFYFDSLFMDPAAVPAHKKIPEISGHLRQSERVIRALDGLIPPGMTRVLYSGRASDRIRHLPEEFLELLSGRHPEMAFILPSGSTGKSDKGNNLFRIDTSAGLADFVTAIGCSDIVVSTDSSAYHIAASLDIPALSFFGPISSRMRTGYYPRMAAVDSTYSGLTCRAPCGISAIYESTPAYSIGANAVKMLEAGTEITAFNGSTFRFDTKKGCPEMNVTGSEFAPCLSSFSETDILEGFEKAVSFMKRR